MGESVAAIGSPSSRPIGACWGGLDPRVAVPMPPLYLGAVLKISRVALCRMSASFLQPSLAPLYDCVHFARGVWNVVRGSFTNTRGTWQRQGPQIRPGKEASKLFRPARGRYPWPASGFAAMISDKPRHRAERVQVFLSSDEIAAIENFRYEARMPSLQAAVRELLRRGLASSDEEERTH